MKKFIIFLILSTSSFILKSADSGLSSRRPTEQSNQEIYERVKDNLKNPFSVAGILATPEAFMANFLNIKDSSGETLIHTAIANVSYATEVLEILLEHAFKKQLNVNNVVDEAGVSPLSLAVDFKLLDAIHLLLNNNQSNFKNSKTPFNELEPLTEKIRLLNNSINRQLPPSKRKRLFSPATSRRSTTNEEGRLSQQTGRLSVSTSGNSQDEERASRGSDFDSAGIIDINREDENLKMSSRPKSRDKQRKSSTFRNLFKKKKRPSSNESTETSHDSPLQGSQTPPIFFKNPLFTNTNDDRSIARPTPKYPEQNPQPEEEQNPQPEEESFYYYPEDNPQGQYQQNQDYVYLEQSPGQDVNPPIDDSSQIQDETARGENQSPLPPSYSDNRDNQGDGYATPIEVIFEDEEPAIGENESLPPPPYYDDRRDNQDRYATPIEFTFDDLEAAREENESLLPPSRDNQDE